MVYIAEVIVDVPTMQTDTPYSYLIPADLKEYIKPGIRVAVPFGQGNRQIQGFVVSCHQQEFSETERAKLKTISQVLDLAPVLNPELLALAEEMKERTFSFKITCLQTMLPSVMKAKYQKWIVARADLPAEIRQQLFKERPEITWEEAEASGEMAALMRLRKENKVEIRYEVKTKNKIKTKQVFKAALSNEQLEEAKENLSKQAKKKKVLLEYLQKHQAEICTFEAAKAEADLSRAVIKSGAEAGWLSVIEQEIYRDPYEHYSLNNEESLALNEGQQQAYEQITKSMSQDEHRVFLLEGVTGSGKTEVYLQTIAYALEKKKTAILLVPEISLTPQMVARFKARFGEHVAVLHSGLSQGEKYDEWRKIERKEASVVVGARSAIFAPLENIGLIIMDEEHESSYKQEETPRYHARDLAIWRAKYHHCPVVLGSATPSLESRARAQKGRYQLLQLPERAVKNALLPTVEVIDMRKEAPNNQNRTFSQVLLNKMQERLQKKEQMVLLLNRRGYSSFVMCRDCGYVLPCPNCDISLTLHMDTKTMKCHYCGHEEGIPHQCPVCGSDKIRYYGTGTQKVEQELQQLLPQSRIIRMDVDTTRRKGAHEKLIQAFANQEADILLGTQMVAKGLDFPNVTLVGVLNADTALNLPDFRSSERTFQLLTQVSGRAGRAQKKGEVVIQTYNPQHYAIQFAKEQKYEEFYKYEMHLRHQSDYPPYFYTVQLITSHEEENQAAKKMFEIVQQLKQRLSPKAIILGPTPKPVMRVNNRYFYQTIIKYKYEPYLSEALKEILLDSQTAIGQGLRIAIDIEPMHFM